MIRLNSFLLSITAILFCLTVQAQGTKEGSVTEKVNESQTISLGSTYSRVLQYNATGVNYRWYSSNTSVATVTYNSYESCTVTGKAAGNCRVYFTSSFYIDGHYRTYDFYWDITVSGYTGGGGTTVVNPTSATLTPDKLSLYVGQSYGLSALVYPFNATYTSQWVSYKKDIVTVSSNGTVTAIGPGSAYIYFWVYDSKGNSIVVETCEVTVSSYELDEGSMENPKAEKNVRATVTRPLTANKWSTICLPFAMSEAQTKAAFGDEVEIADFTGYETEKDGDGNIVGIKVNFNDVTAMEANHPYIIKAHNNVSQFTVEGVDVVPTDDVKVVYDNALSGAHGSFIGTYVADVDVPDNCLFINDNKFWYSSGNTKMKAYRAYFDFQDVLPDAERERANTRIQISLNRETTGIKENTSCGVIDNKCYDLFGHQINKPTKGVYIKNGKKYVIK